LAQTSKVFKTFEVFTKEKTFLDDYSYPSASFSLQIL